jgi:hypothetical protein
MSNSGAKRLILLLIRQIRNHVVGRIEPFRGPGLACGPLFTHHWSRYSDSLNLLEPSGLVQACNGIAFFFFAKVGPLARSLWLFLSPHSPVDLREVTGDQRKLHKEELLDFYSLPNNIFVIRSIRMRRAGHMAYNVSTGKPEGKRQLARPKHKLEDNIKNYFKKLESEGVKWVNAVGCCEHFQICKEFLP